eukprot:6044310-Pleurochrysis_carterae.AAC.2
MAVATHARRGRHADSNEHLELSNGRLQTLRASEAKRACESTRASESAGVRVGSRAGSKRCATANVRVGVAVWTSMRVNGKHGCRRTSGHDKVNTKLVTVRA